MIALDRRRMIGKGEEHVIVTLTWNQLVGNGNFSGTSNWSKQWNANFSASSNIMTVTKTGGTNYGAEVKSNTVSGLTSHIYFIRGSIKADGSATSNIGFHNNVGAVSSNTMISNATTEWYTGYVRTSPKTSSPLFLLRVGNASAAAGVKGYFKNVIVVDLTTMFGAGKEPSADDFNNMFPHEYYTYNTGTSISGYIKADGSFSYQPT